MLYPWCFRDVRKKLDNKVTGKKNIKTKEEVESQTKTMVMIPLLEWQQPYREFTRSKLAVAMKPHKTLKQLLVHPKDKRSTQETVGEVYSILYKDCDCVYVGETGRRFGVRQKAHMKDKKQEVY